MIRSHDETTLHDEVTPNDEMNKEMRAKRGCDRTDDDAVVASNYVVLDEMQGR